MKLDRNITTPRRGKYALVKLREPNAATVVLDDTSSPPKQVGYFVPIQAMDFGDTQETDFFVIRLKDRFAGPALRAYAHAISEHLADLPVDDSSRAGLVEYHHDIIALAEQAHRLNPRTPD